MADNSQLHNSYEDQKSLSPVMTYTERYDILLVKSNCPDHTKIFSKVSPNNKITPRILNKMIAFDFNQTQRVFSQIDSFVGTPQGIVLDTALFQTHLS